MTWLLLSLGGAAGLFYGLWQRSRADRFRSESSRLAAALAAAQLEQADAKSRYEALVASLKAEVTRLEEASLANATPDQLRDRLAAVLRPRPT